MYWFYLPDIENEGIHALDKEESQHSIKVLRLKQGSELFVTNGKGKLFKASVLTADTKECTIQVLKKLKEETRNSPFLHIAIAPTKNSARLEWFLEKATEIGIGEITPIFCKHSERTILKSERLNKILISAAKQSLKTTFPVINSPIIFNDFIKKPFNGEKFMAYCEGDERNDFQKAYSQQKNALILIGPEGDFDKTEVAKALELGYKPVTFGENRLRTETAALYACFAFNFMNRV